MRKTLAERAKELQNSLPFMEGKEKGEMKRLHNDNFTIREYGFLIGEDEKTHDEKEYVCFVVDEDTEHFYFGGQVLTESMKELEEDGYHEEINSEGLPVYFESKKSKNKREYTSVIFYPEDKKVTNDKKSTKDKK